LRALSLVLRDEIFFKLKPAIIEIVLAGAMGAMLALPVSYLKGYIGRQLRGIAIPDAALPSMKKSLGVMLGVIIAHAALTVYASFAMSTAAWGFISGGLLYILFGVYAVGQFASAKLKASRARAAGPGEEMLPLIDEEGKVIGVAPRSECHKGPGKLHPVVHLQIVDGKGGMYLQKRSASKDIQPGKVDVVSEKLNARFGVAMPATDLMAQVRKFVEDDQAGPRLLAMQRAAEEKLAAEQRNRRAILI